MAVGISILGVTSGNGAEVDSDNALKIQSHAPAIGSNGAYQVSLVSGSVASSLASCSTLFSMRWTNSTHICLVKRMRVSAYNNSGGTLTASSPWAVVAYIARGFTAADSGGTAVSFTSNQTKLRTSMASSLMGSMMILTTTGITAGTRELDSFPLGACMGASPSGTSQTQFFNNNNNGFATIFNRTDMGMYPIVLAKNEGIVVQTPLNCAGPNAGTFVFQVEVEWEEVAAY